MTTNIPDDAAYSVYVHLAAARVAELQSMDQKLASCSSHGGRSYQKLPRHMQRRALSTNPKRVPRRMRSRHVSESQSQPRATKRPRRMHRSRPRDKVEEYTRRQQRPGNTWLETHVWHAKRFHMGRNWGYALPLSPTQKMYRPTLRAVKERCIMQDRSFLCCLELRGPRPLLLSGLKRVLSSHGHEAVTAQGCQAGTRWAAATLYQPDRCPSGAVSEFDLLWITPLLADANCNEEKAGNKVALSTARAWLWVHPSAHEEVLHILTSLFDLKQSRAETLAEADSDDTESDSESEMSCEEEEVEPVELMDTQNKEERLNSKENIHSIANVNVKPGSSGDNNSEDSVALEKDEDVPKSKMKRRFKLLADKLSKLAQEDYFDYLNSGTGVSVVCLKDTLNRFTLRGPETVRVLKRVLAPTTVEPSASDQTIAAGDPSQWWISYFADHGARDAFNVNTTAWETLTSAAGAVDDNLVLPLLMRDPRVMLPTKREQIEQESDAPSVPVVPCPPTALDSPLFNARVRHSLLFARRADHQVNEQRHNLGVPGSLLPLDDCEARVPALLLLRRPERHDKHSAGCDAPWELVLPGGWGSTTWTALVYSGAVAAGIDSDTHLVCEEHQPPPVYLLPDTPAGQRHANTVSQTRREDFFKMPPNKRPNFVKLGVQFPFSTPWSKLLDSLRHLREVKVIEDEKIGAGFADEVLSKLGLDSSKTNETTSNKKTSSKGATINNGKIDTQTNDVCVMRNPRHLKALDYLTCKSGSRRRIFRGISGGGKENKPSDKGPPKSDIKTPSPISATVADSSLDEVSDSVRLVQLTSQGQLVRVLLTLIGGGSIEACATICRPTPADLSKLKAAMECTTKPSLSSDDGILEDRRKDEGTQQRKDTRKEHQKDLARLRRLRKAARRRVRQNYSFDSGVTLEVALEQAVDQVHQKEKAVVLRSTEYIPATQQLWLLPEDGPLQQCSRLIIGYVTEAAKFSNVRGCSAGHGYVVAATLMGVWTQRLRRWADLSTSEGNRSKSNKQGGDVASCSINGPTEDFDVELPLISNNGIPVLVRNTNSLQYMFAMLTVAFEQPPP